MTNKPKIAMFDLTGCQGCEFHLLSLDESLADLFQDFEITNWRLLQEPEMADFDVAFVEGAATTSAHVELLKKIRATSKIVVALGACAITGNVFYGLSAEQREAAAKNIYGDDYKIKSEFLEPIEKFIKVDEKIQGCPPDIETFKTFLQKIKGTVVDSPKINIAPPDYTAKIEGHGTLRVDLKERVASFKVEESERLVEQLLVGKTYIQAPFINSRVCGICPISHNLCSWAAIENALKIKITSEVILLRELLMCGQMIKSHLMHLFFLVLPDYAGLKGSIELSTKYPAEFHLMLNLKRLADNVLRVVAGSDAFPTNTGLAGFIKPPEIGELSEIKEKIYDVLDEAVNLAELFGGFNYADVSTDLEFLTIDSPKNKYPLYYSKFVANITEIIDKNSTTKFGIVNACPIKVGALARLALAHDKLNPLARKFFGQYNFNIHNPFSNNLAQAIEVLHFLEESIKLIEKLEGKEMERVIAQAPKKITKQQSGAASLEAPRGTLTHQVILNPDLTIANYNIIPPTQINLAALQVEFSALMNQTKKLSADELRRELEKLIRAFDPCITCAVH
ncbi:nickel-dependent hydrogenase large subunit [Candidatus Falkowbacteria bacterium]|nr:nickel-dependent hydrogenase large subunit [Candidatus Falkowbacteria bacterium]